MLLLCTVQMVIVQKFMKNSNGVRAIYVCRSIADRDNNSLSIESQKEDCVYRIYCDSGFSGEDTEHRPAFQ